MAWQRLEGLAIFILVSLSYVLAGYSFVIFIFGLLIPDISMLGYLVNNRVGAFAYNIGHSLTFPLLVFGLGYWNKVDGIIIIGLIWLAHIGMDRTFGYGLKKNRGFMYTHLGDIKSKS
ncbi:DUF4260 domain-containing protein [Candidatus Saccharibacteria bacterium]|nr:DUF4260 domain-containing protein [Candidatus Saccharibacteria bacterium]